VAPTDHQLYALACVDIRWPKHDYRSASQAGRVRECFIAKRVWKKEEWRQSRGQSMWCNEQLAGLWLRLSWVCFWLVWPMSSDIDSDRRQWFCTSETGWDDRATSWCCDCVSVYRQNMRDSNAVAGI